jgi:predicted nucleic acid-binding protein
MYLVDTSVWIRYLQGGNTEASALLDKLLDNPLAVGINHQIYLEILQGARDEQAFNKLDSYFSGNVFMTLTMPHPVTGKPPASTTIAGATGSPSAHQLIA